MGGSPSKVGRALPTKTKIVAGKEVTSGTATTRPISRPIPGAKEFKNQDIERDGKDPQLLANLSRIGQVNVDPVAALTNRTTNQVLEIFKARDVSEQQAVSTRPVQNRLAAVSLSSLLDDRKYVTSQADLRRLADRYTIDIKVLEGLTQFVNTPSIGEGTVVRTLGDDGAESITMKAVWTEPNLKENR